MSKKDELLKLALEEIEAGHSTVYGTSRAAKVITAIKEALADNALDRMAENARELRLDYEPPCKTGSQCTSKCQQCEHKEEKPMHPEIRKMWEEYFDKCFAVFADDHEKFLAQPAQQCWKCGDMDAAFQAKCTVPACGMKEQPAQDQSQSCYCPNCEALSKQVTALKTCLEVERGFREQEQPAQQQEPVAKVCPDLPGGIGWNPSLTQLPDEGADLYTSPPASKPWASLTNNEIALVNADYPHPQGFARAIEAKLREKNA